MNKIATIFVTAVEAQKWLEMKLLAATASQVVQPAEWLPEAE